MNRQDAFRQVIYIHAHQWRSKVTWGPGSKVGGGPYTCIYC